VEVNHRSTLVSHGLSDVWTGCAIAIRFEPTASKFIRSALMQGFLGRQDCNSLGVVLIIRALLTRGQRPC